MNKLLTIFLLLISSRVFGQETITFEHKEHDFGVVEEGKVASFNFVFKNSGSQPITLKDVKASCGCTTPNWPKEAIQPGKSSQIEVQYNSQGRPGPFSKSITVTYDSVSAPIVLMIKGNVKHVEPKPIMKDTLGGLAFDQKEHMLGTIKSDEKREIKLNVQNVSKSPIVFLNKSDKKAAYQYSFSVNQLKPDSFAVVTLSIDPSKWQETGWKNMESFADQPAFYVTEAGKEQKKPVLINGVFQKVLTQAEKDAAPKIVFDKVEFNGGNLIQGEKLNYAFKFKNAGKSTLVIESAKPSCGCTASLPRDKEVAPGMESQIEMSFDSAGRSGTQSKTITVTSNDPANPTVVLRFTCNVVTNPFNSGVAAPTN